ncbi:hypothetical protein MTBUT4_130050 [Magnetospirillum sp. UT-4]|nr:hypothetical protein MTBUT4_130050 [Magnetospirillum sp. UT-4]
MMASMVAWESMAGSSALRHSRSARSNSRRCCPSISELPTLRSAVHWRGTCPSRAKTSTIPADPIPMDYTSPLGGCGDVPTGRAGQSGGGKWGRQRVITPERGTDVLPPPVDHRQPFVALNSMKYAPGEVPKTRRPATTDRKGGLQIKISR